MPQKTTEFEPALVALVDLCKKELRAEEVWLFGSRARGDNHAYSDWDLLAILPDDATDGMLDPVTLWNLKRKTALNADLLAVKRSDFEEAQDCVTALARIVKDEGIRVDV